VRRNALAGVAAEADLTVRAARLLQRHAGVAAGVDIELEKHIPMGGGLGGGSSDAATVLVALNRLWGLQLPAGELAGLGLQLGADVPVFVHGQAAWAEGVGEQLTPLEPPEAWAVVVHPGCSVGTREIFTHPDLTRDTPRIRMHAFSTVGYRNDCEKLVRQLYPAVNQAFEWLVQHGQPRLTGTGACVYLLLDSASQAQRIAQAVPPQWNRFVARTLNRSPLLAQAASAES
jgi:4-diphosphocytidyl-2-C-methyl-D-erythritol kinase